jgi:sterol 3beta-glucosyltransferase
MHHGGSGTTHSVARAGKPQVVMPLIIDQPYWAYRVQQLKIGPPRIKIGKVSDKELKEKVYDLVTNPVYKKNAEELGEKIRSEQSTDNFCDFIESMISPKEISEGK